MVVQKMEKYSCKERYTIHQANYDITINHSNIKIQTDSIPTNDLTV